MGQDDAGDCYSPSLPLSRARWALGIDCDQCARAFVGGRDAGEPQDDPYNPGRLNSAPGSWSPFYNKPRNLYNTGQAVCGARGCTPACMISLKSRGVLQNKFKQKFRRRPSWSVDWETKPDYAPGNRVRIPAMSAAWSVHRIA